MKLHIFKTKSIIALILTLCLSMPIVLSAANVVIMAAHTHECGDDEHKEYCANVRACCYVCQNYDSSKNRTDNSCGTVINKLSGVHAPALALTAAGFAFLCANPATLISLKVRLNN